MKLKFNWATGITIFIIIFILSIGIRIIISLQNDVTLITKEYYPKGVAYQKQIDKINNLNKLGTKVDVKVHNDSLLMQFPSHFENTEINGNILLYRPSNDKLDKTFEIKNRKQTIFHIPVTGFEKGRWIMKIDWTAGGVEYYQEIELYL